MLLSWEHEVKFFKYNALNGYYVYIPKLLHESSIQPTCRFKPITISISNISRISVAFNDIIFVSIPILPKNDNKQFGLLSIIIPDI